MSSDKRKRRKASEINPIYDYDDEVYNFEPDDVFFENMQLIPKPFPFPFKTKKNNYENISRQPKILKDTKLSSLVSYQRPYFSPKFHSWEMDFFETGDLYMKDIQSETRKISRVYLIFININTKFIKVYPLNPDDHPTEKFIFYCFKDMMKNYKINSIRGDHDRVFTEDFQKFLDANKITHYFSASKYTNKNRVVDRAIRTIRDAVGLDKQLLLFSSVVLSIVDYYNNTPHIAYKNKFTPQDVQNDPELEAWYIRTQQLKLIDSLEEQRSLRRFKPGDLLLVYRPLGKTDEKYRKRRRNFDELATFVKYSFGNIEVELLKTGNPAILPIYYVKFICSGEKYKKYGVPKKYNVFLK
jgi:hypothetical protein